MHIPWDELQQRYDAVSKELLSPSIDHKERGKLQKESSFLANLLGKGKQVNELEAALDESRSELEKSDDEEMKELFTQEVQELQEQLDALKAEIEDLIIPQDPLDERSAFIEIRAGAGGQEAALFAGDLIKMYTNYALSKGWRTSIVDLSSTDLGGIREATLFIEGKNVYKHLRHEAGVHRVQRVPKTETQGRVHTSTATVAVLPEVEEIDIQINPADLRIDTYRAGGAGGQHVNKTDSAVRITHIPTGVVVACQDERSQHKNKAKAMKQLQARLVAADREKKEQELGQKRKEMVGTGMRAEKVRTYNYPQNRVSDHQVNVTLKKLDMVMQGQLDELIEPLMQKAKEERKKQALIK